ncbi:MAG: hypothetical protein QHC90_15735 [Shinella sp.]|nr:hypothetical protein [Shinella sp.]
MKRVLAAAVAVPLLAALLAGPAQASGSDSACGDPAVLGFITSRFEYRAAQYLGQDVSIFEIRKMAPSRFEPFTRYISSVERQYCHARVTLTDGRERPMWYVIERPWGFAGVGRNIEFCIGGLDPWHVYGARCSSLR